MKHSKKTKPAIIVGTDWARTLFAGVTFHGHLDVQAALELAVHIFGDYYTLDERTATINQKLYQHFTFGTAEQLFDRAVAFERANLNRQLVVYLFGVFSAAYFSNQMNPQSYANLKGVIPFSPGNQPMQK